MARLTRTQKYADLREQISHDREESLETQELNKYQEKLNDVKSQFGSAAEPVFRNEPVVNKPVELKETISDKVAETEKGRILKGQISQLTKLLEAYKQGIMVEKTE